MKEVLRRVSRMILFAGIALCYTNCNSGKVDGGDTSVAVGESTQNLEMSFCDDQTNVTSGRLCAIKPSRLDKRTKDTFGAATVQDQSFGFGYHVVAVPNIYRADRGLWIHFTGTYGRPYNQASGDFSTSTWLNELLEQGYVVLQIAYDNRFSINDTCLSGAGKNRNNCAGEARAEVLIGFDYTPLRETDSFNSIEYRLEILLSYLQLIPNFPLPSNIQAETFTWADAKLSGHSQGGNQAYYIAKYYGVKFACMLGSPYDVDDTVYPSATPIADWFRVPGSMTPVNNLGQFITQEDDNYNSFNQGAGYIGLTDGVQAYEASSPPYFNEKGETISGHAAAVGEPKFKSLRASACSLD